MAHRSAVRRYVWLLLLVIVVGCAFSHPAWANETAVPGSQSPLAIGLVPQDNAVRMVKKWQPFAEYLAEQLHRPVEITIMSNYWSATRELLQGKLDLALLGSFAYVKAASSGRIVPIARRVIFGSDHYCSIVVVRIDSAFFSLAELAGKRFAFTDRNSTTGYALPVLAMKGAGLPVPERFFSDLLFTGNHDSALLAVYSGLSDGAALSTTRLDPRNTKLEQLRVVWRSEAIPLGPFVARKELGSAIIEGLRAAILGLSSSPGGRLLLDQIGVDGFVPADERDYRSLKVTFMSLDADVAEE